MGFLPLPEGEGLERALEGAKRFAEKVIGPPLEEIGVTIQDHVRSFRLRRQISLFLKARERLEAAGIEPESVPLKTVVPLLEGASLEDDPDLQDRWVGLLTSAASGRKGGTLPPAFPVILRQLTPLDAQVLDILYNADLEGVQVDSELKEAGIDNWGMQRTELRKRTGYTTEDIDSSMDSLIGLGLVEREPAVRRSSGGHVLFPDQQAVWINPLGRRFTRACRGT